MNDDKLRAAPRDFEEIASEYPPLPTNHCHTMRASEAHARKLIEIVKELQNVLKKRESRIVELEKRDSGMRDRDKMIAENITLRNCADEIMEQNNQPHLLAKKWRDKAEYLRKAAAANTDGDE